MIRVLQVVNNTNQGGIENLLMNLYRNMDRKKVQFDFLKTTFDKGYFDEEILSLGGRIHCVPKGTDGILKQRVAIGNFFSKNPDYKIVHHHLSALHNCSVLSLAKRAKVPIRIAHSHNSTGVGGLLKVLHEFNKLRINKIATDTFSCSDLASAWLFGKSKLAEKTIVLNNAIDTAKFKFDAEKRKQKRSELGFSGETVIGHIGRFAHQKNHEFILRVFAEYLKMDAQAKLVLVGTGELKEGIEKLASELQILSNVLFLGVRKDTSELLSAFDLFLMPSRHEGFPVTLVEAQSSGLPCLVSNTVTQQVAITERVHFYPLETAAIDWAKALLEMSCGIRVDGSEEMKEKGYDIGQVATELCEFYSEKLKICQGEIC